MTEHCIGAGRTAEVFDAGDGRVLKLFRPGFAANGQYEYAIAQQVAALNVGAPAVYGTVEMEGRFGIVYAYVGGESMLSRLESNPMRIRKDAHRLAALQVVVNSHAAHGLPRLTAKLESAIRRAPGLDDAVRSRVLDYLATLPDGDRLCHFDFHPDNILLDESGQETVIDWPNACAGDPYADACRTALIMSSDALPPDTAPLMAAAIQKFRQSMRRQFEAEYLRLSGGSEADIRRWLAPVAAARLSEAIPEEEAYLHAQIREGLGESCT